MSISMLRFGFFTVLVVVVVLEFSVRLLDLAPPLNEHYGYFIADPILPYRTAPDAVFPSNTSEFSVEFKHNSHGFRDEERSYEKTPGSFRILALGDSFAYGAGASYENTYLRRLEKQLIATSESDIEVIKAGIPRYFPEAERLLLQHYGLRFKPDLILVSFIPNDVMDSYMGLDAVTVSEDGYLRTIEAEQLGTFASLLYKSSHVARILLRKFLDHRLTEKYEIDWPEVYKADGLYEWAWQTIEAEFEKMITLARAEDAEIVFVHIPISPSSTAYFNIEDVAYPADRLKSWAMHNEVLFIDTAQDIFATTEPDRLFWTLDGHPNEKGYQVIADSIFKALENQQLVPN